MNASILNEIWKNLANSEEKDGYKALMISATCTPELFLATDQNGYRCLLLFLPAFLELKIRGTEKERLALTYVRAKNVIFIKLKDSDFTDLFNDLIISLYSKIKENTNPKSYSEEFIRLFYKWTEFFEDRGNDKLSEPEIIGLIGELSILNDFLQEKATNDVLSSWRGPYDAPNDFVLDAKNIEVKTKLESKSHVKISSEFQLNPEFGKGLELWVLSIRIDLAEGVSIYNLLHKARQMIRIHECDLTILYSAIAQKGLTIEGSKTYNNYRYTIIKCEKYNCNNDDFPALNSNNIPKEVTKLKYNLSLTSLAAHLFETKEY